MNKVTSSGKRQRGISTVGIIAVIGIFSVIVITFFTVFPMYYGNFKVKGALEKIQQDPKLDPKSKRDIWTSLEKRLYVDEVRDVKRENVHMERKDGKTTVTITYETRDNLLGNLFIGASFSESVVINR
jgi:hypothetical protein